MARKRPEIPFIVHNPHKRIHVVTFRATQAQYDALKDYMRRKDVTMTMALEEAYNLLMEQDKK